MGLFSKIGWFLFFVLAAYAFVCAVDTKKLDSFDPGDSVSKWIFSKMNLDNKNKQLEIK